MKKKPPPREAPPPNNPFGALAALRDQLPAGYRAPASDGAPAQHGPARAVVRMERKGRSGKEVTAVEQLGLRAPELEVWLKALKTALGCGGAVEKDALLLQGDQRDRVKALLEARGVRRVILG
ncbi:MAG TPA: translation initiation factor [Myxococcales bacterium]|jgi:translation initiation factor 1|nr:translation initiation factor [Myxococcales bacterium]